MFVYAVIRASELKENITVHDYAFAGGWPTYFSSTWGMRLIYKDGVGARGAAVTIPHSEKGFIYSLAKYTEEYGKATPTSARSIFECMVACGSPPLPHPAASGVGPATSKKRKREVRVWNCDAWGRVEVRTPAPGDLGMCSRPLLRRGLRFLRRSARSATSSWLW